MTTKNINLEEKEIFDILVALKQRRAACVTAADEFGGCSLDYDVSDPRRKLYDERATQFSDKAKELTGIITKLESL